MSDGRRKCRSFRRNTRRKFKVILATEFFSPSLNTLDLYSGCVRFDPRPGHRWYWLSCVLPPSVQASDLIVSQFHEILSKMVYFLLHNTGHYIWNTESIVKQPRNNQKEVYFVKKNPTRCNSISKYLLFHIYMKLNMFRTEPKTALTASAFSYVEGCWTCKAQCLTTSTNYHAPTVKPKAASAVLGSWWWTVCRPKHVELHINME
jgi:hypothetical protein